MSTSIFSFNQAIFTIVEDDSYDEHKLDVSLNEEYTFASQSTDTALQDGSIVSDHIINKPFEQKVSGIISNAPIEWGFGNNNLTRSKEFYKNLIAIRDKKLLLTLVTGLDSFPNMTLQNIHITRDKDKGKDLFVDLSFKQLKIVEIASRTIKQSEVNDDLKSGTSDATNKGMAQGTEVSKNSSIATKILGVFK
jgi:hypothetical protein